MEIVKEQNDKIEEFVNICKDLELNKRKELQVDSIVVYVYRNSDEKNKGTFFVSARQDREWAYENPAVSVEKLKGEIENAVISRSVVGREIVNRHAS